MIFSHPQAGLSDRRPPAGDGKAIGAVHRRVLDRRVATALFDTDRAQATVPCTQAFSPAEWQTIYVLQKKQAPPKQPPSMRTTVRMLARLGGFLACEGDGEPGPETLWRGFEVLRQSMRALEIMAALGQRE